MDWSRRLEDVRVAEYTLCAYVTLCDSSDLSQNIRYIHPDLYSKALISNPLE